MVDHRRRSRSLKIRHRKNDTAEAASQTLRPLPLPPASCRTLPNWHHASQPFSGPLADHLALILALVLAVWLLHAATPAKQSYMRANFEESPVYAEIKGTYEQNPWREALLNPINLKYVVIATIVDWARAWSVLPADGFQVDTLTSSLIVGAGLIIGTPALIFFGSLFVDPFCCFRTFYRARPASRARWVRRTMSSLPQQRSIRRTR